MCLVPVPIRCHYQQTEFPALHAWTFAQVSEMGCRLVNATIAAGKIVACIERDHDGRARGERE
jgi:hypothetical protein